MNRPLRSPAACGTLAVLLAAAHAAPVAAQERFDPNVYVAALAGPALLSRALVTTCGVDTGTQNGVAGGVLGGVRVWRRFHLELSGTLRAPIAGFCRTTPSTTPDDGTIVQDSFPTESDLLGSAQLRVRYVPRRGGYSVAVGGGWLEPQGALVTSASFLQFIGGAVQFGFGGTVTGVRIPCLKVSRTFSGGALVDEEPSDGHCWRALLGARLGVVVPAEVVSRRRR